MAGTGETQSADDLKRSAAFAALDFIENGMRLGIGTGSTAEHFIRALAEDVAGGLKIVGVPTSERTRALCAELGIPLTDLDETPELDLTVDGADEIDQELRLIKGGGGALLREKIVASASSRMIVIADGSKLVEKLGAFPLPIEINPFGFRSTVLAIEEAARRLGQNLNGIEIRKNPDGERFVTDGGHWIADASFGRIVNPNALAVAIAVIPGVVDHGIFTTQATIALVAGDNGVERVDRA